MNDYINIPAMDDEELLKIWDARKEYREEIIDEVVDEIKKRDLDKKKDNCIDLDAAIRQQKECPNFKSKNKFSKNKYYSKNFFPISIIIASFFISTGLALLALSNRFYIDSATSNKVDRLTGKVEKIDKQNERYITNVTNPNKGTTKIVIFDKETDKFYVYTCDTFSRKAEFDVYFATKSIGK
ncbi:MAG: hypothetical protein Q8873_00465 [Bacillota bacterium]|nr:hypothetical protein [Bacillota bacterium]